MRYVKPLLASLKTRVFEYDGKELPYAKGIYNGAFSNERTIELAIVFDMIKKFEGSKILEIGNVTQNYKIIEDIDILDKYEKGYRVINKDIMKYDKQYDLIVSISTFEHIGQDEEEKRASKVFDAIEHCKKMLLPGGKLLITIPTCYNVYLDNIVTNNTIGYSKVNCYKRVDEYNRWIKCELSEAKTCAYNAPFHNANGLIVLEFDAKD